MSEVQIEKLRDDSTDDLSPGELYAEFTLERGEILRHKWIESEKAGYDIGFEKALLDWIVNHRVNWREERRKLRQNNRLQKAA